MILSIKNIYVYKEESTNYADSPYIKGILTYI